MARVMLLKDWNGRKQGRILTPGDGVSNLLVRRGMATLAPLEAEKKPAKKTTKKVKTDDE